MSDKKLRYDSFGGKNAEQYNALMSAIIEGADAEDVNDNEKIYEFIDLPKASLVCGIVDQLHSLGYKIIKDK